MELEEDISRLSEKELEQLLLSKKARNFQDFKNNIKAAILRKNAEFKLPNLISQNKFSIPNKSILEQASSELTAEYKSRIVEYKSSVDLTAGLGVDSYYIARTSSNHIMVEPDEINYNFLCRNFKTNDADITIVNKTAEEFLKTNNKNYDLIYFDPARRDSQNRFANLEDFQPNPIEIVNLAIKQAKHLLIKLSPMLDAAYLISKFKNVSEIHAVSIDNECRELLLLINPANNATTKFVAVNYQKGDWSIISGIGVQENHSVELNYGLPEPDNFLYEPNSSIMKLNFFEPILEQFEVLKFHPNSHLFYSNSLISDFPGRAFKIIAITKVDKSGLENVVGGTKCNLTTRNFPMKTEALKKKLNIRDGGDFYVFATQLIDNSHRLVICKKVSA